MKKLFILIIVLIPILVFAQAIRWGVDGHSYYRMEAGEINRYLLPANNNTAVVSKADLTPNGQTTSPTVCSYSIAKDKEICITFMARVMIMFTMPIRICTLMSW